MKRLLVFSYFFPPSNEVAGKPTARLLKHLALRGWEIVVVVPPSEAYFGIDRVGYADIEQFVRVERTVILPRPIDMAAALCRLVGRVISKFRPRHWRRNDCQMSEERSFDSGSKTRRDDRITDKCASFFRELLMFPDHANWWIIAAYWKGRKLLRTEAFDAVLSVSPLVGAHLASRLLRKHHGNAAWVAQFHDPWIDNPFHRRTAFLSTVERYLEKTVITRCDLAVFATSEAAEQLVQRYPQKEYTIVPNGFDVADFPAATPTARIDSRLTFIYTGALYGPRDPTSFLFSLASLLRLGQVFSSEVRVRFIGDCEWASGRRMRDVISELQLEHIVELSPPVSYPEALRAMAESDVLLLFAEGQDAQVPAKIFEYFHIGKNILAFATGASARLVQEGSAGKVVSSQDEEQIQDAIMGWVRDFRDGAIQYHGNQTYFEQYSAERIAITFEQDLIALPNSQYPKETCCAAG